MPKAPAGMKLAAQSPDDAAAGPRGAGDEIHHHRLPGMPASRREAHEVHGESLVRHAVGEEGQETAFGPAQVDRKRGTHEEMPQVDHQRGQDDGRRRGSTGKQRYGDELGTPGVHQERHAACCQRMHAGFLRQYSEGQSDGNIAETDGPGRFRAVFECRGGNFRSRLYFYRHTPDTTPVQPMRRALIPWNHLPDSSEGLP